MHARVSSAIHHHSIQTHIVRELRQQARCSNHQPVWNFSLKLAMVLKRTPVLKKKVEITLHIRRRQRA
jgi:hypothetical protein